MKTEEQFVIYEIALKFKELGFDDRCFGYFSPDEELVYGIDFKMIEYVHKYHKEDESVLAPLWQQVIDWFREKHNLSIDIFPISSNMWFYSIRKFKEAPDFNFVDVVKSPYPLGFSKETYQESRKAAVLKAIEIVKKEKNNS